MFQPYLASVPTMVAYISIVVGMGSIIMMYAGFVMMLEGYEGVLAEITNLRNELKPMPKPIPEPKVEAEPMCIGVFIFIGCILCLLIGTICYIVEAPDVGGIFFNVAGIFCFIFSFYMALISGGL